MTSCDAVIRIVWRPWAATPQAKLACAGTTLKGFKMRVHAAALAQRLHLRARERHPGLVALEQVVLMPGTAVVRDHFLGHGSIVGSDQGHSG